MKEKIFDDIRESVIKALHTKLTAHEKSVLSNVLSKINQIIRLADERPKSCIVLGSQAVSNALISGEPFEEEKQKQKDAKELSYEDDVIND